MRSAAEIVAGLVAELLPDGDTITLEDVQRRRQDFSNAAWDAPAASPEHAMATAIANHLRIVSNALQASRYRL